MTARELLAELGKLSEEELDLPVYRYTNWQAKRLERGFPGDEGVDVKHVRIY